MLLKLSLLALLAVALGQTVEEKGNLGELIKGVFGENQGGVQGGGVQGGGENVPNEKVSTPLIACNGSYSYVATPSSHATAELASAFLTTYASTARSTLTEPICSTFVSARARSASTTLSSAARQVGVCAIKIHDSLINSWSTFLEKKFANNHSENSLLNPGDVRTEPVIPLPPPPPISTGGGGNTGGGGVGGNGSGATCGFRNAEGVGFRITGNSDGESEYGEFR